MGSLTTIGGKKFKVEHVFSQYIKFCSGLTKMCYENSRHIFLKTLKPGGREGTKYRLL